MAITHRFEGLGFWALPLSWVYACALLCHKTLYRVGILSRYKSSLPVISIGNIIIGGSGKSPMTVWVCSQLLKIGICPAIALRGYTISQGVSDEALMFQELLPDIEIIVGANRKVGIENVVQNKKSQVIVCDDAFQHWPLERDLDIVLIDATNPFGNGMLLPAGILREPLSALKRAGIIVVTKSDDDKPFTALALQLHRINPQALIVRSRHKCVGIRNIVTDKAIDFLPQERVLIVSAIADPASFYRTVGVMGLKVEEHIVYRDHAAYTPTMVENIVATVKHLKISLIVTTHKDAVKLKHLVATETELRFVCIDIQIDIISGEEEMVQKMKSVCHA